MKNKDNRIKLAIMGISGLFICIGILLLISFKYLNKPKWDPVDMGYLGYREIIFVGDSRTVNMEQVNTYQGVKFVGKYGEGLNWLKEEGWDELEELVKEQRSPMSTAVIFNLGVNDYKYNADNYIPYFREIATTLEEQNCYLFYMSVNPIEEAKLKENPKFADRTNDEIQAFNEKLREGLKESGYVWLDMNQTLQEHGFATKDGLHYTKINSSYILSRAIKMMLDAGAYTQDYCWCKMDGNWYAIRWKNNSRVKNAWIHDGKGKFYLDPNGRLVRDGRQKDENGDLCEVGSTGRAKGN